MSKWRVVIAGSDSLTGVAPVCGWQDGGYDYSGHDPARVFECCPWPRIEMWSEPAAMAARDLLNENDAELRE